MCLWLISCPQIGRTLYSTKYFLRYEKKNYVFVGNCRRYLTNYRYRGKKINMLYISVSSDSRPKRLKIRVKNTFFQTYLTGGYIIYINTKKNHQMALQLMYLWFKSCPEKYLEQFSRQKSFQLHTPSVNDNQPVEKS